MAPLLSEGVDIAVVGFSDEELEGLLLDDPEAQQAVQNLPKAEELLNRAQKVMTARRQ